MSTVSKSFPQHSSSALRKGSISRQTTNAPFWLQLIAAYALLEAALWTPPGPLQIVGISAAAIYILIFAFNGRYSLREMGLTRPALAASVRIVSGGLVLAAITPLIASLASGNLGPKHLLPWHAAWQYALWALVQQFILQSFFYVRLESLLGSRRALLATAVLFAVAHIPNPVLTGLTLVGGLFFCEMFRRYRNIFPLSLAHAIVGLAIAASFSIQFLHHMRVGIAYLRFQ